MQIVKRPVTLALSGLAIFALVATALVAMFGHFGSAHAATPQVSSIKLRAAGTAQLAQSASPIAAGLLGNEFAPDIEKDSPPQQVSPPAGAPTAAPSPDANSVAKNNPGFSGFQGVNHFDNRLGSSSRGNQFSLEPPDQGLCVGNGFVIEPVNDVLSVYSASTHARLGIPTALNAFFGLPFAINRSTGVRGPFLSDPKCYFDAPTGRFFLTVLELDVNPASGAFTGPSSELIAVSRSNDATGAFNVFRLDTTDDGSNGTPSHPGCPCLGDQPLIGADANGFYISTNEFPTFVNGFNGAQLYAISKSALETAASGAAPSAVQFNLGAMATPNPTDPNAIWYSVQPATTPPGGSFSAANGGTEYLLSALDFDGALDNRVAAWALANTSSLNSASPSLTISNTIVSSEVYGVPVQNAPQKNGSIPFGHLNGATAPGLIATNDDRMNQVVFAKGKLYSAVNTTLADGRTGIAWFVVEPSSKNGFSATMKNQGYISVAGQNTLFPSIGVNADGQAVATFTVVGPNMFPSAGYARVDGGNGKVHIGGAGVGPQDGFSEYSNRPRWGDYSAAVAAEDGSIWLATEYIAQTCTDAEFGADTTCGHTRTLFANWSTFVSNVNPAADDNS